MKLHISITRKKIILTLSLIIAFLTVANIIHQLSWYFWEQDFFYFSWRLDVSGDKTIPGWFSSVLLLFCAGLIYVASLMASKNQSRFTRHWQGLAFIFLFLSLDETAALHEWSGAALSLVSLPKLGGFLLYSWVIFGFIFVSIFLIAYLRFFWHLPKSIRIGFFVAGVMFVGGALGLEMVNARIEYLYGASTLLYQAVTGLEELLEMSALVVLADSVLRYLEQQVTCMQFYLFSSGATETAVTPHALTNRQTAVSKTTHFEEILT